MLAITRFNWATLTCGRANLFSLSRPLQDRVAYRPIYRSEPQELVNMGRS